MYFRLLKEDDKSILANLKPEEFREFRSLVIEMVLFTDMSTHFAQIKHVRSLLNGVSDKWVPYCPYPHHLHMHTHTHPCNLSIKSRPGFVGGKDYEEKVTGQAGRQVLRGCPMHHPPSLICRGRWSVIVWWCVLLAILERVVQDFDKQLCRQSQDTDFPKDCPRIMRCRVVINVALRSSRHIVLLLSWEGDAHFMATCLRHSALLRWIKHV